MEDFEGTLDDRILKDREFDVEYEKLKNMGFKERLESMESQNEYLEHPKHKEAIEQGSNRGKIVGELEALIE